jgi:hypothetical protein
MRFQLITAIVLAAWAVAWARAAAGGQDAAASTTWSGIYTEAQAEGGAAVYSKNCSECHLDDLAGDGFAPALKGPEFMSNWNSLTVGDLFERIRVSMPPSNPNSVSLKEKAEIVSHILKQNGFPAGTTELPGQTEALKAIKFEAFKPGLR